MNAGALGLASALALAALFEIGSLLTPLPSGHF